MFEERSHTGRVYEESMIGVTGDFIRVSCDWRGVGVLRSEEAEVLIIVPLRFCWRFSEAQCPGYGFINPFPSQRYFIFYFFYGDVLCR